MVIKLTGEGNAGVGTKTSWDLYVRFHVETQEKWLTRDGVDLHYDLEIDFIQAVLGTKMEVNIPVIWKRSISIGAGTQSESILKISGDGVKHIDRDSKWDLLIHIHIPTPTKLSKAERDLFETLAKEKKLNVNSKKWVFEKLFG
jgi:molecular chaperone DnaJ